MLLSEHSAQDLERRYLGCYGEMEIRDRHFYIQFMSVSDEFAVVKLYNHVLMSEIPRHHLDYKFTFNLPRAGWIKAPDGPIIYVQRIPDVQFRRGICDTNCRWYRVDKELSFQLVPLTFDLAHTTICFSGENAEMWSPGAKDGFLLPGNIAVLPGLDGNYRVYVHTHVAGSARQAEDGNTYYFMMKDVFREEMLDSCRKMAEIRQDASRFLIVP